MKFRGTRSENNTVNFTEAVLTGMASNGGLWVPENLPIIDHETQKIWKNLSYNDICFEIMKLFIEPDEIPHRDLYQIITDSFSTFSVPEVVEIKKIGEFDFFLNLFHGPTFAFKDIALQFLGNLFDYIISKGIVDKINIIGSTSGDTGSAAIAGIKGKKNINCFILFPKDRTSLIQEMQMTTQTDDNIHCISIEGTYDNCQAIVKEILNSSLKNSLKLAAVNSINFARILSQMIYFWYTSLKLCDNFSDQSSKINFTVPTGNFGNILSAYYAKKMNAPINHLIIASNANDILTRFHSTGQYKSTEVIPTISPSMDIQVSSNFERVLFEIFNNNIDITKNNFELLKSTGEFKIENNFLDQIRNEFFAYSANEQETKAAILEVYNTYNYIIDPHTAVGYVCYKKYKQLVSSVIQKHVIVSTAHYGKFIDSVESIISCENLKSSIPHQLQKDTLENLPKKCVTFPPKTQLINDYLFKFLK